MEYGTSQINSYLLLCIRGESTFLPTELERILSQSFNLRYNPQLKVIHSFPIIK